MKTYRTVALVAVLIAALAAGLWLASPAREPAAVPAADLRGHWTLDEADGQRLDSSAYANHLADPTGVDSAPGRLGLAADFERDDGDHLAVGEAQGSLDITGSLTLVGWAKPESILTVNMMMVGKYEWGTVPSRAYRFGVKNNHLYFVVSPDGQYLTDYVLNGQALVGAGSWRHVAAVFDADNQMMALYLDGRLDATRAVTFNSVNVSTAPFTLGANMRDGVASQHFDGALDEWHVYARALTESEIRELIALTVPGWELVVDVEIRDAAGGVVAGQQVRVRECQPDGQGGCSVNWAGELPAGSVEWVRPYLLLCGHEIALVHFPDWCEVDRELCQIELTCEGEMTVAGTSAECLAEVSGKCGLEPDGRGFWPAGSATDGGAGYTFFEPLELGEEWYDYCPSPPATPTTAPTCISLPTLTPLPTYTPLPTLSPDPTPMCQPTWTPWPTPTDCPTEEPTPYPTQAPYPTQVPLPTNTPYPPQPPWE